MYMKNTTLESPFSEMLDSYLLALENRPDSEKGISWNVFLSDFEKAIVDTSIWSTFMRNPLGIGVVTETLDSYHLVWGRDLHGEGKKLSHNYEPLIDEDVQDSEKQELITKLLNLLLEQCGFEFFKKYNLSDVGSPARLTITLNLDGKDPVNLSINQTDMQLTHYFYQIVRTLKPFCNTNSPVVLDIGAGYGGVMAKMKKAFSGARCILLDLPDLLPVQIYYLNNVFPEYKFLYYRDWLERGSSIFEEDFDFLIAPNWMIKDIPEVSVDQVINMRSMMEMSNSVISSYFKEIQRITKIGGLFACVNRYLKEHKAFSIRNEKHIPGSSAEINLLKTYPYDDYWKILLSQTSIIQPVVHDLIVRRQSEKNLFPIMESMKSLPPS